MDLLEERKRVIIVVFHGAILLPCENEIVEEAHSYKELG